MAGAVREFFEEINSIDICHWFSPAEHQRTSGSGGMVLIQIKHGDHTCWRDPSWAVDLRQCSRRGARLRANCRISRQRVSLLERQREGIAKPKREGRHKGRVPTARRKAGENPAQDGGRQVLGNRQQTGDRQASVYRVLGEQMGSDQQEAA
jgi:hypothetical protein